MQWIVSETPDRLVYLGPWDGRVDDVSRWLDERLGGGHVGDCDSHVVLLRQHDADDAADDGWRLLGWYHHHDDVAEDRPDDCDGPG